MKKHTKKWKRYKDEKKSMFKEILEANNGCLLKNRRSVKSRKKGAKQQKKSKEE